MQVDKPVYGQQKVVDAAAGSVGKNAAPQPMAPPPQGVPAPTNTPTPVTNLLRMPPEMLNANRAKTETEQRYDIGLAWRVLAESPGINPITQQVARRVMGGK